MVLQNQTVEPDASGGKTCGQILKSSALRSSLTPARRMMMLTNIQYMPDHKESEASQRGAPSQTKAGGVVMLQTRKGP
jgi:hypothetical protein